MRRPAAPSTARPFGPAINAWLEERLAAPLPPCEVRQRSIIPPFPPPEEIEPCGATPSVAVLTFTCTAGCRPPWRRSACATHVKRTRETLDRQLCGQCRAPATVGGLP